MKLTLYRTIIGPRTSNSRARPKLAEQNRERSAAFRARHAQDVSKFCTACKIDKPLAAFGLANKTYDRRQNWCGDCKRSKGRKHQRALIVSLRAEVFDALGHACVRCGFADKRALQIDHVFGNGLEDARLLSHRGVPFYRKVLADRTAAFQILCANCNWIKRHENGELPARREQ